MMRLTGGQLRGRKVRACGMGKPSVHGSLRATSSRVREAVFNILGQSMDEMVFVDLYSGTGTMGMEAMSRGARRVFFVESDPGRHRALREMLEGCGCGAKAEILNRKAENFVLDLTGLEGAVDVFYLDPPYDSDEVEKLLPLIARSGALASDGIVLCEHSRNRTLPDSAGALVKAKTYKYGDTMLSLYRVGNG